MFGKRKKVYCKEYKRGHSLIEEQVPLAVKFILLDEKIAKMTVVGADNTTLTSGLVYLLGLTSCLGGEEQVTWSKEPEERRADPSRKDRGHGPPRPIPPCPPRNKEAREK